MYAIMKDTKCTQDQCNGNTYKVGGVMPSKCSLTEYIDGDLNSMFADVERLNTNLIWCVCQYRVVEV